MERIGIVTDSTADLSLEQRERYNIRVVPISVHLGSETYADGVDLSASEFYRRMTTSPQVPRTSQPSPQAFADVYREVLETNDAVISIHLSRRLSGTLNSSEIAGQLFAGGVIPVDAKSASQGVGRSVVVAAEAVRRGWSLTETLAVLYQSIAETFSVFSVDTLEYLMRNGRIGKAASYLGSLLSIKPILYADDEGGVAPFAKVRGRARVVPRLLEAAKDRFQPGTRVNLSVVHSGAVEAANRLLTDLLAVFDVVDYHLGMVGPGIGAHIGPGALGLMIQPSFDDLASGVSSQALQGAV